LYKCPYCERQDFRKLNDQRAHIGQAHPGMDLNVCAVCYKTYSNRYTLATHLKRHTDERPFVCGICNKGFLFRSLLSRHMRLHTGERPYACGQCDQRFSHLHNLSAHMRNHTGEKPYACTLCEVAFRHANSLTYHMQTCHPSTYDFNKALKGMLKDQQNRFSDFAQAHHYISELFQEPTPANRYQQCPHCGENVADLDQHIELCPWRQGPSWE
jgi:uncharacterized Zn-finger protein